MYTKALLLAAALPSISAFLFPMPAHRGVSMAPVMGRTRSPASVVSAVVSAGSSRTQAKSEGEDRALTLADVKGSSTDPAWSEVPEEVYFVANYAAAIGGDYPPENVDKSYWDQIKDSTYSKLASLAKTADPSTISPGQYVILCESIVREAIKADPKKQRPTIEAPELTAQQNYAYDWANSVGNEEFAKFKKEYRIEDMTPQEWWSKIDEVAADNAAKGIKLPELTVDLTADPLLGVAREEFVKSIRQFLKVESEMFPVFIITNPGSEEGTKLVDLFNKTLDIPTRFYEVYGFDAFKFKIKSAYDWGEARLEAIEQLTGTRELPVVYVNGTFIGGAEKVMAKYADGSLKKTTDALRQEIIAMVQERFPPQQGESMYIGMKKVTPEEYKAYQANLAKTGGLDPLEASRQKAKEAIQTASQKK